MTSSKVTDLLVQQAPLYTAATSVYPYSPLLEKKFQAVSRFGEPYSLCRRNGELLHLPRAVCPVGVDRRSYGAPVSLASKFPPRNEEQARVIAECVSFLKAGHSGILQASTGFGKTYVASQITAAIGTTTMVVVTKDDLFKQWRDEMKKFLGLSEDEIGVVRQDSHQIKGKKFVVAMLHSISKAGRYPQWVYEWAGLLILDEVHRLAAEELQGVLHAVPAALRLGLSATPDRQDGRELLLHAHIGPIRAQSKLLALVPKVLRLNTGWECPRRMVLDPKSGKKKYERVAHAPGKCGHIVVSMAKDPKRNANIVKLVHAAYSKSRNTVVFTDLLDHIDRLESMLIAAGVPANQIARYVGGMKPAEREQAKAKKVVLATYQMAKEGTDVPWWDTCVLATPKSEVEQIIGRILREYPNKPQPVVFDLCDQDSPVFAGYANSRSYFYRRIKADIKSIAA